MPLHRSGRSGTGRRHRIAGNNRIFRAKRVRAGLDIANAVLGVLVVLVPTMLVGVCRGSMMHCHMVTMPTLIVLGVLLAALAAVAAYLDLKPAKRG